MNESEPTDFLGLPRPGILRRGNAYKPPVRWPHGTPFRIGDDIASERDAMQAAALVDREGSTLDEREHVRLHTRIDEVCLRVWANAGFPESTLVWYHPDTRDFWAYPGAPAPPETENVED